MAIGLAQGPAAGLAALDLIDTGGLRGYHLMPAARADFLRRLERWTEAAAEYRRALAPADNARERAYLAGRLAACEHGGQANAGSRSATAKPGRDEHWGLGAMSRPPCQASGTTA